METAKDFFTSSDVKFAAIRKRREELTCFSKVYSELRG